MQGPPAGKKTNQIPSSNRTHDAARRHAPRACVRACMRSLHVQGSLQGPF